MSETATKLLENRIAAIIQRMKELAAERDSLRSEFEGLKARMESHERENTRLRTVLDEAVRELRQE